MRKHSTDTHTSHQGKPLEACCHGLHTQSHITPAKHLGDWTERHSANDLDSRLKHQLEVVLSGSLEANALIRASGAQSRLSRRQVPFQLQHNIVTGRTSKMLKGQEGNILPFVIRSDQMLQQ